MGLQISGGGGGTLADNAVTSAKIADGAIVNADINASAAIARSKLANPLDLAWTVDPRGYNAVTTIPDGTNRGVYIRVEKGATISKLGVLVGTSSGNISLAVYSNAGAGLAAAPTSRLATTGAVACPAATTSGNVMSAIALDGTVTVNEGDWFFLSCDNVTATFYRALGSGSGLLPFLNVKQAAAHPAPTSAGTLATDDRPFIIIGFA